MQRDALEVQDITPPELILNLGISYEEIIVSSLSYQDRFKV